MKRALAILILLLAPAVADAAGWVLIGPPRHQNGHRMRNVPVNRTWTQIAAFDSAAQCEDQRMVEIATYKDWFEQPEGQSKDWLRQMWTNEHLLRGMPYDLWWKAQQQTQ